MANPNKKSEVVDSVPRKDEADFASLPARKKLPKELQSTLDSEEKYWEALYEGKSSDSTDTSIRYAAYASRVRTILLSAHRYVAYTSDIGESFRPVAHPYLVRGAYGVSWAYLVGDVVNEGYKAYLRNQRVLHPEATTEAGKNITSSDKHAPLQENVKKLGAGLTGGEGVKAGGEGSVITGGEVIPGKVPALEDYRAVAAQRAVFQAVASMGLPAFTIHSIVRYSGQAMKGVKNQRLRTWGPIGLGLAAVPFLPFVFDKPVEEATEWIFFNTFKAIGGPAAVEGRPVTGNKELRGHENRAGVAKEKEL